MEKALIRDRDERGCLEAQLEEANARVDNVEQLAQAEANSRNAAAAAALREERAAQREAHRRERAAERRRDEAELRCETLQTEVAMLRALLPKELQAQVPRTPARDRSPKLPWRAAKTQAVGSERREAYSMREHARRGPQHRPRPGLPDLALDLALDLRRQLEGAQPAYRASRARGGRGVARDEGEARGRRPRA